MKISIYPYFSDLGVDNFEIKLLKKYEVVDSTHLRAYEHLWLSKFKTVNINQPFQIMKLYRKKYYKENKEQLLNNMKKYYEEHKDRMSDYQK